MAKFERAIAYKYRGKWRIELEEGETLYVYGAGRLISNGLASNTMRIKSLKRTEEELLKDSSEQGE